jgi:hypothetical protein
MKTTSRTCAWLLRVEATPVAIALKEQLVHQKRKRDEEEPNLKVEG